MIIFLFSSEIKFDTIKISKFGDYKMIELLHGKKIRLSTWDNMTTASFSTLKGYLSEIYSSEGDFSLIDDKIRMARKMGNDEVWCTYVGMTISSSPKYYHKLMAEVAGAITISHGDKISVDNKIYQVIVLNGNTKNPIYSDPIKFIPV